MESSLKSVLTPSEAIKTVIIMAMVGSGSIVVASLIEVLILSAEAQQLPPHKTTTNLTTNAAQKQQQSLSLSTTDLFKRTENSVVQITSRTGNQSSLGVGFIYDKDGHILTSESVIRGANVTGFDVTFVDGNSYTGKVIGKDPNSDLAVLQLDKSALSQEKIQPLPILYNSSTLQVGQPVYIIGSPFGLFPSLTDGLISGLNRLIPSSKFSTPGAIQIDGIVNPGDSGPVLSADGKVIGLTSSVYTSNNSTFTGINFAVPSNTIQRIVPQLILHGSYIHPLLGISGRNLTPDITKAIGLNQTKGVIVSSVAPGSPAAFAGITNGTKTHNVLGFKVNSDADFIVGIDNKQVRDINDLISYIDSKSVGDIVVLKVLRNGTEHDIDIKLTARPNT